MKTIRELRSARGWTQKNLADEIGATRQAVWYWETGRREPGVSQARAVAKAFGVCMEDVDFEGPVKARRDQEATPDA